MKKIALFGFLTIHSFALSLDDILNDGIGGIFDILDTATAGTLSVCYVPEKISTGAGDICSFVNSLSELEMNVCDLAPNIPGFQKKQKHLGLSGLKSLCDAQVKDFSNIASTTASNVAQHYVDETGLSEDKLTLANGMKPKDFAKRWNISSVLKKQTGTNLVREYIKDGKQEELKLLMDFDSSILGGKKDITEITIDDLKAPQTLEDYNEQRDELAKSLYKNNDEVSTRTVSNSVKVKLSEFNDSAKAKEAVNELLNNKKEQLRIARANEVGQRLRLKSDKNDLAIPTEETVQGVRRDLRPKLIAQIRKQQIREAEEIAKVNEKWDKREAMLELIAEKELIMNEKFDENSAKKEIETILAGVK